MKKPFFSFVIPCCDVEPYIRECLASVTGQSFQDWECLIGFEPSKDRTEEVIAELTAGDDRFRFFHGPRSGSCSASRNTGIDMARGEYVIFLDGDDSIEAGSLARIAEKINERPGADMYPCAIKAYNEDTGETEIRDNYSAKSPAEMTGNEAALEIDRLWSGPFCPMLQLTVFRREFLVEHKLKCIYGLRRQDSEFSPRALYRAKRVVPLHEPYYLYRIWANSVSNSSPKDPGRFHKDWAVITRSLLAFYAEVSREPDFDARVAPCWVRQWIPRMISLWFLPSNLDRIERSRRVETLQQMFPDGFDSFDSLMKYADPTKRIMGWFLRLFVRHPACRWTSEQFFRLYYTLCEMRGRRKKSFRTPVCAGAGSKQ